MPAVATVEERRDLGERRSAWDLLVAQQDVPSPFQRSWWLTAVAPRDTTYLLVHAGGELAGGLALGTRRTLGTTRYGAPGPTVLCPDHLDALAAPGADEAVVDALADWFSGPGQRLIDVRGVASGSLLARAVGGRAEAIGIAPYQPLSTEGYLAVRSSGFRRSVRRGRRRLAERGYRHRRVAPDEVPGALADFERLHESRAGRAALLAEMTALSAAVLGGVGRGEARVDVLASEVETVAVTIGFVLDGRLSLYQVARSTSPDHDSAGTVLLVDVIEDAATTGCTEVDLLRGDESYKQSFADHERALTRVRAAHGARASAQLRAEDAARSISARLRSPGP